VLSFPSFRVATGVPAMEKLAASAKNAAVVVFSYIFVIIKST
jgi:hypothetical protein